jgi:hypothetical protein
MMKEQPSILFYAQVPSAGLPSEQHAALVNQQKAERLHQRHANEKRGVPRTSTRAPLTEPRPSRTNLTPAHNLHRAAVRSATRKALRTHLDDSLESSYNGSIRAGRENTPHGSHWDYRGEAQPIPQKYIDEFNKKWHEDDEDNEADQYMADVANAPWRIHQPVRPIYTTEGTFRVPEKKRRVDGGRRVDQKQRMNQGPCQEHKMHSSEPSPSPERSERYQNVTPSSHVALVSRFSIDSDFAPKLSPMARIAKRSGALIQSLTRRK